MGSIFGYVLIYLNINYMRKKIKPQHVYTHGHERVNNKTNNLYYLLWAPYLLELKIFFKYMESLNADGDLPQATFSLILIFYKGIIKI